MNAVRRNVGGFYVFGKIKQIYYFCDMSRNERIRLRNNKVREVFSALERKYPQWKLSALLEETARQVPPIAPATVSAILKGYGIYGEKPNKYHFVGNYLQNKSYIVYL